jgi:hypothetical protein
MTKLNFALLGILVFVEAIAITALGRKCKQSGDLANSLSIELAEKTDSIRVLKRRQIIQYTRGDNSPNIVADSTTVIFYAK